ncbi:Potassium efflux system KefA protein [Rhodovulum sp. P5]|uniref:DUF3772 domain-containing protein n=1 Tax=Rhodovulum sp. P5 TaxID=1564506 RepID=UPI0009C1F498|nr:DUF3772 domain-containing protein [Rhodovulum sp. P5]ARE39161.1 Potassium efflux system KefA protein [Rhodovulum sp. P5]
MNRVIACLLLGLVLLVSPGGGRSPVFAQASATDQGAPDYEAWERLAARAEEAVSAGKASNAAFEQLRSDLADWRARFLTAQNTNAARIKTLRDQIAALGPVPDEGTTEPEEIAARRTELNKQLAALQAPGLRAVEAHSLADGLIEEIDTIIRERQAKALLQLGPSPLNPVNWPNALGTWQRTLWGWYGEVHDNWKNPIVRTEMRRSLPATILFLVLAGVLLLRSRHWMERLTVTLTRQKESRGRTAYSGLVSLGQIALPFAGVFFLTAALNSSSLAGVRTEPLVALLPILGLTILFARWLGGRVFMAQGVSRPIFNLTPERMAEGRINSGILGVILALQILLGAIAEKNNFSPEALAVSGFALVLAGGLMLARMGQLLLAHARAEDTASGERPYRNRMIRFEGNAAIVVGLIGPTLGAIGYTEAANYLVFPSILTLALFGFVLVLQRFVVDIYDLMTGTGGAAAGEERVEALIPVLIGMVLALLALPVLALIWGARVSDLTEVWSSFKEGFSLGETRISPADFLTFIIVFALLFTLTRVVQGTLRSTVLPKTKIDPGGQESLLSIIGYVGMTLALVLAITTAGIDLSSLAIVAGALSVGIGFGLQTIVQNFVSGIILLLERPVTQGDWIEVGGTMGIVKQISVRSTRIQTFDRTDVIVPNADLISGTVTNWTKQNLTGRVILNVGVAYGSDTKKVEQILMEIGQSHPLVMVNPAPTVVFQGFGADALEFELRVILRDINYGLTVRTELNHEIARRFTEEGLEIPFAQRDIWLRNPESLRPAAAVAMSGPAPSLPRQDDEPQPDPRPDLDGDVDEGDGPR